MGDPAQGGDERQDRRQDQNILNSPIFKNPWRRCLGLGFLALGGQLTEVTDWSWDLPV
jgi:hypothetical protein